MIVSERGRVMAKASPRGRKRKHTKLRTPKLRHNHNSPHVRSTRNRHLGETTLAKDSLIVQIMICPMWC